MFARQNFGHLTITDIPTGRSGGGGGGQILPQFFFPLFSVPETFSSVIFGGRERRVRKEPKATVTLQSKPNGIRSRFLPYRRPV